MKQLTLLLLSGLMFMGINSLKAGVVTQKPFRVPMLPDETDFHRARPSSVAMQLVNRFQQTISGQSAGATIAYACKFAYSGGMSVTS